MALVDKIPTILDHVKNYQAYLDANRKLLEVYDGNLLPYVLEAMQRQLSKEYFEQVRERVIPINVLKRITQKTSRSYLTKPQRFVADKYKEDLAFYEKKFYLDSKMQRADEYASLFKGYALEPFINYGEPQLRVLPYDRFLPFSDDPVDNTKMTAFVKFMGKRTLIKNGQKTIREVYHIYTDEEFASVDATGESIPEDLAGNGGVNPYGVIPFIYGNRGNDILIPTPDTDTMALTKMVPLLLTDLSGAIMFQCFSIVYGIDVNSENLTMSPNAFWSLKSDKTSDKTPSVGTIKPEADIDKVMQFVMTTFAFWLETRGIRVGAMGQVDASNAASGIAKIIDEIDATELIQKSQNCFMSEEHEFWELVRDMQNYWVANNMLETDYKPNLLGMDFEVTTQFDPIEPAMDRQTEVQTVKMEVDSGFLPRKQAMMQLYPDLPEEEIDARILRIEAANMITVPQSITAAPTNSMTTAQMQEHMASMSADQLKQHIAEMNDMAKTMQMDQAQ